MPATYEPIATFTADATARTITFSSIPATYTDLRIVFVGRVEVAGTGGYSNLSIRYNSNTSGYSLTEITGNGAAASSSRFTGYTYYQSGLLNYEGSPNSLITIDLFSYAGSTYKTALTTSGNDRNGSGDVTYRVALWQNTAAVTSISLDSDGFGGATGRDFANGSTFTLYGIKNA
jgi:hypothetical protein